MRTVYLDYNATTPLDPAVREAMLPLLSEVWGNPSSIHHIGRQARTLLDDARERGAQALHCKSSELIFTSGGTESANLAVFGAARLRKDRGRHIITSAIEHHAVLHACQRLTKENFKITVIPVNSEGIIDIGNVTASLRPDTILVSVMAANNEIGTLQPVAEIGSLCRDRGVLFHTDAVQWFGKEPLADIHQFNADLVSICAHKMHGPKGSGALFIRSPLHPEPILYGGAHENERRAGTENLAGIVGLVECLERFVADPVFPKEKLLQQTRRLERLIDRLPGAHLVGSRTERLANTVSFVVEGTDSIALLAGLDIEGVCASSGSACSAGSLEPSHVVRALGLNENLANALVRFSLGRETTDDEIVHVESVLPGVVARAKLS